MIWILVGFVPGLGLAAWIYLNQPPPVVLAEEGWGQAIDEPATTQPATTASAADAQTEQRDFDFYTQLPKLNAKSDPPEPVQPQGESPAPPEQPAAGTPRYVLQAGSFRNAADAERRREVLEFLGIQDVGLQSVDVNGATWHRVRIGPSANLNGLKETKSLLNDNNIRSVILRAQG